MNKLPVIDRYAARLLMVSFFLPMRLQVWVTMATGSWFVLRSLQVKAKARGRNYLWALLLGSLFLLYLAAVPFAPEEFRKPVMKICEQRVSLLFMPFAFAIIAPAFLKVIMDELLFFVYGCVAVSLVANADFAYHYLSKGIPNLTHVQYRTMIHYFVDIHPTYLSMYQCFAICILLFTTAFDSKWGRVVRNIMLFLLLIMLLALLAKTPVIALGIVFLHYLYVQRKALRKLRFLFLGIVLTVVAAWAFIPFVRQRVNETLPFLGIGKATNVVDNSVYARRLIWDVDTKLVKENWLTGVGPGKVDYLLEQQYHAYSLLHPDFPVVYHDPHNEYFVEWLSFGIGGPLLLAVVLAVLFTSAIKARDHLFLYLLIILSATFLTETVLSLQRGVMMYAVLTSLFFYYHKARAKQI